MFSLERGQTGSHLSCPLVELRVSSRRSKRTPILHMDYGSLKLSKWSGVALTLEKGLTLKSRFLAYYVLLFVRVQFCGLAMPTHASTLSVGPGQQYATPCAAIAAASPGDTIQIDPSGNYAGDVCAWGTNNLHILGTGSTRVVIDANGNNSQGKGTWVINGADGTIIENIEFKNAAVPDSNGAGIRIDGGSLTVRNCYFHDNQDGILAGASSGTMLVEFSEFFHNGAGDGFSHNIYVGNYARFIFRYNYSHGSVIGHLFKSRAAENNVYYNRLTDEATGTASYEIDIPNGGKSYIVGNLIEKGPNAQNSALVSYQEEGASSGNPDHELFIINNTMVNDYGHGTFVSVDGSVTTPVIIKNNIFQGSGTVTDQSNPVLANNFSGNADLVNPATYDYHLQVGSPAIDAGADPGTGSGVPLAPTFQYVHPSCAEGRATTGSAIDIGAYEFNGGNATPPPNAPSRCGTSGTPAPTADLSVSSLAFGAQTLNTTSPGKSVSLTNNGNATLSISGISITGADSGDFAQTNTCGSSLAAGANCSVSVTFTPAAAGSRSASVSMADNATASPQTVTLSGSGILAAPVAVLAPTNLTFTGQNTGTTSTAQQIKLTNSGNATLNIANISASGDFAQTNTCGPNLGAGSNCTINVTFTPTAGGARNGSLMVSDDASGSPQTASLTGAGLTPGASASLSPASLSFPGTNLGSSSASQQATLTNTGSVALGISGVSASGDFNQTNTCGTSLAGGANCKITVTFIPTANGLRSGTLSVSDDASGSPQTASLTGTGLSTTPSVSLSPTSLNFPGTLVTSSSATQQVKLTNSGNGALSISGISASGDYSQTNNCGASLGGAANCSITVTFKPTAGGSRTGSVSIADNATGSPQTVSLAGTGMDFSLSASPSSASVNAGQAANLGLVVSPDGGFNQGVSFACSGAPVASTCTVTPSSVTPNGSSAASVSIAITTTAHSFIVPRVWQIPPPTGLRFLVMFATFAIFCVSVLKPRRRLALGFCTVVFAIIFANGCAGIVGQSSGPPPSTGGGTPAGTYTITFTGTSSGNLSHSFAFTLKVN